MHATVRHVEGLAFMGKGETNHWVPMDGPAELHGSDAGSRPKELLLLALGGCTGADVASILRKRRVDFRKFELVLEADASAEHPVVFTHAHVRYRFEGEGLPVAEIERAIRLSQDKYCAVSAMLRRAFPITWSAELNGTQVLASSEVEA